MHQKMNRAVWLLAGMVCAWSGPLAAQTITGPAGQISAPRTTAADADVVVIDDMRLDPGSFVRTPAGATASEYYWADPWPGGIVPLLFDEDFTTAERALVWNACRVWSAGTSVRCVDRVTEQPYVRVTREVPECSAHVGRRRDGKLSTLTLGADHCWSPRTLQHEIGHLIGFIHEHQRSDRDDYVVFRPELLTEDQGADPTRNFAIIASTRDHTPYDFGSVLHYFETSGSTSWTYRVLEPRPQYWGVRMGGTTVSALDGRLAASIYGIGYLAGASGRPGPPTVFRVTTHEAVSAMRAIDLFYRSPDGLARPNGLSIGGRPDFLGLAAWFFDVYLSSRFAGYEEGDARYNVAAQITQTDEWRGKHPGQASATPLPGANVLPFDRAELLAVMERLDRFYAAPEGLQRPNGLSIDGRPDFLGISAWVVEYYLGARMQGAGPDAAWQVIVDAIRASDEWRAKH